MNFNLLINFLRDFYKTNQFIPLHAPIFPGNECKYVQETIDSTFVSSVGKFVNRFELDLVNYTNSPAAIATTNGTSALHSSLVLAGVGVGDLVITQALTFVATCNAIAYCGAEPVFIDVDIDTMGLSPSAVSLWLEENAYLDNSGFCRLKNNQRRIKACVPMHTFGHPVELDTLVVLCNRWNICLIEDAAESLGSLYKGRHTGTVGMFGVLSFNGNKIITTGGGGAILTSLENELRAKHLTTTAKIPHPYEFFHDEVGYNYRMPNINAALGCAQLERLENFIFLKRKLAMNYADFFKDTELNFFYEPKFCRSNYWLNAVICQNLEQRNKLLKITNEQGVMTRPIWTLMNRLPMYSAAICGNLRNSEWLEARVVNLPSSVLPEITNT